MGAIATFEKPNVMIEASSHRRDTTSRQPPASSARKRASGLAGWLGRRSASSEAALTANVTASAANTQPGPIVATNRPETDGPNTLLALRDRLISALPCWRRSALTV